MSKIVKVSQGDYRVSVVPGGKITLDTGPGAGDVFITGNLTVQGTSTTVESANLEIEDNLILLNRGESGVNGISLGFSGIQIDRGVNNPLKPDVLFVFDETVSHYDPLNSVDVAGTFVFKSAVGTLYGIQTNSITTTGATDLVFDMQNQTPVLKVVNSTDYYSRVLLDDHIPNRKWVTNYVDARPSETPGAPGVASVDRIRDNPDTPNTKVQTYASNIQFFVGAGGTTNRATISSSGLDVDKINLFDNTITGSNPAFNLNITAINKTVEFDAVLWLDDQIVSLSPTSGKTKIYSSAAAGPGKTGLFFVNNTTSDELVAKDRALLLSILF